MFIKDRSHLEKQRSGDRYAIKGGICFFTAHGKALVCANAVSWNGTIEQVG